MSTKEIKEKILTEGKPTPEMVEQAVVTSVENKEKLSTEEDPTPELAEQVVAPSMQKIYIGPNLLSMTTYTVIEDNFPLHIESLIEKCPAIEKLCVPLSDFVESEKRTKTKGTLEHRQFRIILEFIQGEGE